MLGDEIFHLSRFSIAFLRCGYIESCWVRKLFICEDFSSVRTFIRAEGIALYWVRKFSFCENFSGIPYFSSS